MDGLAEGMFILELVAYTITSAYCFNMSFPFLTWGENALIAVQNIFLLYQMHFYTNRVNAKFALSLIAYLGIAAAMLGGLVPVNILLFLQSLNIPIFTLSRVPQIYKNFRAQSTGQLSVVTALMNLAGSSARVFTTLQEMNDTVMFIGTITGVVLNGAIVAQIVLYWSNTNKRNAKKADSKAKKEK